MLLNDDNTIVITSNRLTETGAPLLEQGMIVGQLSLADALIIGNCNNQVKNCEVKLCLKLTLKKFVILIMGFFPCKIPNICEE